MTEPLTLARLCRCHQPLQDEDGCLRCGRWLSVGPEPEPPPWRLPRRERWTRAGVIRAIRAFAFFRERTPVRADWNGSLDHDLPSLSTVEALFGSLVAALHAAGLPAHAPTDSAALPASRVQPT
jgi:hypothetical protein